MSYIACDKKLCLYPCIEHIDNKDVRIAGSKGFIWRCDNGDYAAVIGCPKVLNRHYGAKDFKYKIGHSLTVYFKLGDMLTMVRRIGAFGKSSFEQEGFYKALMMVI